MIGIVGGMGPEAAHHLLKVIHRLTPALKDQDHLPVCLLSAPHRIPDRTEFLLNKSLVNPSKAISEIIKVLADAGATIVAVPCNTCHCTSIFQEIILPKNVKLLHMIEEVAIHVILRFPSAKSIGVLCSTGTLKSKAYDDVFSVYGMKIEHVPLDMQENEIQPAIYGIKSGDHFHSDKPLESIQRGLNYFQDKNVDVIILGCTEISLLNLKNYTEKLNVVDSSEALALALIKNYLAGGLP